MRALVLLLLIVVASPCFAQTYPDVDAFLDAFFAKDAKTLIEYLPARLQNAMRELPDREQAQFAEEFLVAEHARKEGLIFARSSSYPVLLEVYDKQPNETDKAPDGVVELDKRLCDGMESVLRLRFRGTHSSDFDGNVLIWMRYEEGQWRVAQVQPTETDAEMPNFDDPQFLEKFRSRTANTNEVAAIGALRSYNAALTSYAAAYEAGFPSSLEVLGGETPCAHPTSQHACLMDPNLASPPFQRSGYGFLFRANLTSGPTITYTLLARPLAYGSAGKRSFYTDESGVIRWTDEDREATYGDAVLQ